MRVLRHDSGGTHKRFWVPRDVFDLVGSVTDVGADVTSSPRFVPAGFPSGGVPNPFRRTPFPLWLSAILTLSFSFRVVVRIPRSVLQSQRSLLPEYSSMESVCCVTRATWRLRTFSPTWAQSRNGGRRRWLFSFGVDVNSQFLLSELSNELTKNNAGE